MALGMGNPRTTGGISGTGGKNVNPTYKDALVANNKPKAKAIETPKSNPKPVVKITPTPKPTAKPVVKPTPKPLSKDKVGGFGGRGIMPTGKDY